MSGTEIVHVLYKGGTAAIDAWYKQYAAQEMKDVKVCFAFVHDPGTFHARKKAERREQDLAARARRRYR